MLRTLAQKAYDYLGDQFGFSNGAFHRIYANGSTSAGKNITPGTSLRTVSVLRCAALITGAAASLPVDVFEKTGKGRRSADDHPVERLLDSEPNPEMSSMDFRSVMWMSFLLWGNAYAHIVRDGNRPIALWPLMPDQIEMKRTDTEPKELVYLYRPQGDKQILFKAREVLHIRWFSLDGIRGLSAIDQARQAIGLNQVTEESACRFFKNGAQPSLAVEVPTAPNDKLMREMRQSFEEQYAGVENAHKLMIGWGGSKFSPVSVNPRDSQFIEQRELNDMQIAMLFGIPPHMIGLQTKSTSWGTGIAEQKLGFMAFTLNPMLVFHEKAMERSLLGPKEQKFFIKHNVAAFLRADIKTRMEAYATAVDKAIFNRNECRAFEDMDPYEGGDVYTVQSQMIPIEMAGKITQPSRQNPEEPKA